MSNIELLERRIFLSVTMPMLGDTDLSGNVNVADLGNLAANLGKSGVGWAQGDFDGSGNVNVADVGDLAVNFGKRASDPTAVHVASPIAGLTAAFDDEFAGSTLGPAWSNTAAWGDVHPIGESQTYIPSAATVGNGVLALMANRGGPSGYTSGEIQSSGTWTAGGFVPPGLSFHGGYLEASIKLPKGAGVFPAFWMMPTPYSSGQLHDGDGEIDVMENVSDYGAGGIDDLDSVHLHHLGTFGHDIHTGVDLSTGFHRYGLLWSANSLTWYFDGKPIASTTANVPSVAEYIILDFALGTSGSWAGAPDATTPFPSSMLVDYLRLWQ